MRTLLFIAIALLLLYIMISWFVWLKYWIKRKQDERRWKDQYLKPGMIWRVYHETDNPFRSRLTDYVIVEYRKKGVWGWVKVKDKELGFISSYRDYNFLSRATPFEEANKPEQIESRQWLSRLK